jgi:hypothetical protein
VIVTACSSKHGVVVEVTGGSAAGTVELFTAVTSEDCTAGSACPITPPSLANPGVRGSTLASRRWIMTTSDPLTMGAGDSWLIENDLGTSNQTIAALLAVQLDGAGKPIAWAIAHDIVVATNEKQIIRLVLHPATNDIQLWQLGAAATDGKAPCAIVASSGGGAEHESFSRADDEDCDGAIPECDKFGVFGSTLPNDSKLTCLVPTPTSMHQCDLGGVGCIDNVPPNSATCTQPHETYCLPQSICMTIGSTCNTPDETCIGPVLRTTMPTAGVTCIGPSPAAVVNFCPGMQTFPLTLSLGAFVGNSPGCSAVAVSPLGSPLKFNNNTTLSPAASGVELALDQLDPAACSITTEWTLSPAQQDPIAVGLLDVTIAGPAVKHHVVPVRIDRSNTASCEISCTNVITAGDSLFTCN